MVANKTHYDVEDEPKADVDTTLAMYEQSKAVVADSSSRAESILGEAGPLLESLYNAAAAEQNTDLMAAVNSAWDKTQELAKLVGQQGAAINGADVVIDVIKKSRQAVMDELNLILKALDDNGSHPKVNAYREDIEEMAREWMYDDAMDYADEVYDEQFEDFLDVFVDHESMMVRYNTVKDFLDMLRGDVKMSAEQEQLLRQLMATCKPDAAKNRAPIEDAEDFEDDEDE